MPDLNLLKEDAIYTFSDISNVFKDKGKMPKSIEPGETYSMEVEMFRTGKFKHPWYGDLNFDDKFLSDVITNFSNGVRTKHIACNVEHEPEKGAIGWIDLSKPQPLYTVSKSIKNSLGQEQEVTILMGWVAFNSYGYSLILDNRFRFWSAEIFPKWRSKEVVSTNMSADGTTVDVQAQTSTPVLSGGAITNDPFINGLGMIGFSENAKVESNENLTYSLMGDDDFYMFAFHDKKAAQEDANAPSKVEPVTTVDIDKVETTSESLKGVNMKFSEVVAKLKGLPLDKQIEVLDGVAHNFSNGDEQLMFSMLSDSLKDQLQKAKIAAEAENRRQAAVRDAERLSNENATLNLSLIESKQKSYADSVEIFSQRQLAAGVMPALVSRAVEALNALTADTRDYKFSMVEGEDKKTVTPVDLLTYVFSAIPKESRTDSLKTETTAGASSEPVAPAAPTAPAPQPKTETNVPAHVIMFSNSDQGKMMPWVAEDPSYWEHISDDGELDLGKVLGMSGPSGK